MKCLPQPKKPLLAWCLRHLQSRNTHCSQIVSPEAHFQIMPSAYIFRSALSAFSPRFLSRFQIASSSAFFRFLLRQPNVGQADSLLPPRRQAVARIFRGSFLAPPRQPNSCHVPGRAWPGFRLFACQRRRHAAWRSASFLLPTIRGYGQAARRFGISIPSRDKAPSAFAHSSQASVFPSEASI